jgi:hypothetical protein
MTFFWCGVLAATPAAVWFGIQIGVMRERYNAHPEVVRKN